MKPFQVIPDHPLIQLQMSLNLIQQARARRRETDLKEPDTSPVKTVLGSLNTQTTNYQNVTTKTCSDIPSVASKRPKSIEEVPFR